MSTPAKRRKSDRGSRLLRVPIFGVFLYVVVAKSAPVERKLPRWVKRFGMDEARDGYRALFNSTNDGTFGLFFTHQDISPELISHECLHLANGILDWIGHKSTTENDEINATLHGYLVGEVNSAIIRMCRGHELS